MHVSRNLEEFHIEIGDEEIGQVSTYSYFGVSIDMENKQEIEINRRITKYNYNVHMLYTLLKAKFVPRDCKIRIYNTILKPIIMYGSEVWVLTTKTGSAVQVAEMRVLRIVRGVTRRDRLRNKDIRRTLQLEPVLDVIERGRLGWYGHVTRMKGGLPRTYLEWQPKWRRPSGGGRGGDGEREWIKR